MDRSYLGIVVGLMTHMLFRETKVFVNESIIPPTPSYYPVRFNLYWRTVVNVIKDNELYLNVMVALFAVILLVPLSYIVGRHIIWRVGKRVWNSNLTIFSHGNYVRLQMPEIFTEKVDVKDWLAQFELYCVANRLTNDQLKKQILLSRMNKECRELIKSRIQENESFDGCIRLVKMLFEPNEPTLTQHIRNLVDCKQSENENVQKYYTELCRLAKLALPKASKEEFEECVCSQFLSGIRDSALKNKLLMDTDGKTKLVDLISQAERLEKNLSKGSEPLNINSLSVNNSSNSNIQENKNSSTSSNNNPSLNNNSNTGSNSNSSNNNNSNTSSNNNSSYNNSGSSNFYTRNCYICGKSGHFAKDCRGRNIVSNNTKVRSLHLCGLRAITNRTNFNEILVPVEINNRLINCVIDTGASMSIINKYLLCDAIRLGQTKIVPTSLKVVTANGDCAGVIGTARCKIRIGGKSTYIDMLVSPNKLKDTLIGMDVLTTCAATKQHIKALQEAFKEQHILRLEEQTLLDLKFLEEQIKHELSKIEAKSLKDLETTDALEHKIEVKDVVPIRQKTRSVPYAYQAEFRNTLEEMKSSLMIEESHSPWASAVRLVKKKDGTLRITVDYRKLNNVTIKDAYPIPRIDNMLSKLSKARIFTTLDLASGYYQVRMHIDSKKYTAFTCDYGFFEYNVMPMGLTNACATFQRLMNKVLLGLVGIICFVYLDDIIIFSANASEHFEHVRQVIERLRNNKLKVKIIKCKVAQERIQYLSHEIYDGVISPGKKLTEALYKFKVPQTVRQVQSFIGLGSYYRKFIPGFSKIASPLIRCTEKGKKFEWTNECQLAFNEIRDLVCSDRVLVLPDFDKDFRLEADASNYGVGAVISQLHVKSWRPVAYFSKHLSKRERSYSTSEKELLAIILAMEHFKQFLYGKEFEVFTDHEPLKYYLTADELSPRLERWMSRLKLFEFRITYRSGKSNANADALSRLTVEDENTHAQIHEEESLIIINVLHIASDEILGDQLGDEDIKWIYELIKQAEQEKLYKINVEKFENDERRTLYLQWDRLRISGHNLYREWYDENDNIKLQFIVPKKHREFILKQAHSSVLSGHLGFDKTLEKVQSRCYWPGQRKCVKKYVTECETCQQVKPPKHYNIAELKPIYASKPFELLTTDILGPLECTKEGNKYILVVCDHFTKWAEAFPLKTMTAE